MKTLLFVILFYAGFSAALVAQTDLETYIEEKTAERIELRKDDHFIAEFFTDFWQEVPEGLELGSFNRGFNAYIMNDYPIGKTNFAIGYGLGLSYHNLYSNGILKREVDDTLGFTGRTEFDFIDGDYRTNKLTLAYVDIPVEIRFRTKNILNNFKVAVGFKAGYNINNYTKYDGDILDGTLDEDGKVPTIKTKEYDIEHIERFRYGLTTRIGYGKFSLSAYYSLTPFMVNGKSKADEMFPISVGIAFTPF